MSLKITYYGHSTFALEGDGVTLLIDPFFTDNPVTTASAEDVQPDYILLTHGHFDHVGDAVAIARRTGATVVANFEIAGWLGQQGVESVHPMHIGGGWNFPFGRVKMTIAHHGSGLADGTYGGNPAGFLIDLAGKKIYVSGDTALTYDMKLLATAGVDVAILCIGDNFTMGPDDALTAVTFVEPKLVVPCHYGTWPYIDVDPNAFASRVQAETGSECVVLRSGENLTV
jgi:L-ascorbate metabolism protein UlaG (beta-lactamase superfamily)